MSDYTITTNFGAKDSLPSGNAGKVIKGSEFTTEFTNIQTAITTKADTAGDTFTGVVNFSADVAVNTNTLFVDVSEAKVGIGTTSPDSLMHLSANTGATLTLESTDTTITANEVIGEIDFYSNDASGIGAASRGSISLISQDAAGAGSMLFKTSNASTASEERMRIDASGNVGIGTTSPDYELDISQTSNASPVGLRIQNSEGSFILRTNGNETFMDSGADILFRNSSETERMRIDSSGNVGIGTDSPSAKLEVSATAPTYTNLGTVLWGGTTNNDNHTGISLSSSGDALGGSVGSNLYYSNSSTATQSNTNRSSGEIKIDNTTSTGTSTIRLGGYVKGTTTFDEHMRIDSSGNLLVGTTTQFGTDGISLNQSGWFYVRRTSDKAATLRRDGTDGDIITFDKAGTTVGSISVTGSATSYNTSSDERLKENIADSADAGSKVDAIQIRQFDWKADGSHQDYGVIAQELVEVAPEAVHQPVDEEDMMGVDYSKLVPMLIKEVQSLRSRVAELENT